MSDNEDWVEWLAVEHVAKGGATCLDIAHSFFDYMEPPLSHRFDVVAPTDDELEHLGNDGPAMPELKAGERVARLVVNELPVHLKVGARDSWFVLCDRCESGPTGYLGGALDALEDSGMIDLGNGTSGTVLHLQNLEVVPWLRRRGIGSRLVRFALSLLSRSDYDVAVAELTPVRGVHPPLTADPTTDFTRVMWEEEGPLRQFMLSLGFEEATEARTLPREMLQHLRMVEDSRVFYRPLTVEDRMGDWG